MKNSEKMNAFIRRSLRNKAAYIAVATLLLYTLSGFFLAPYLIKTYGPGYIQKYLNHPASIGSVRINPFIFTIECKDFSLTEPRGVPILEFRRLFVDFEISSMFSWAWTFREFSLDDPGMNIVVESDGAINLAKLLPPADTGADEVKTVSPLVRLVLHNINITDGEIDITDMRQSTPANVKLLPLNLSLKNISTLPEREGPYSLVATSGGGESISWTGEISLAPLFSEGKIAFKNIQVATAWKFIRDSVNLKAPEGRIDMNAAYRFELTEGSPQLTLDELLLSLEGLQLVIAGDKNPFFELQQVRLDDLSFDLAARKLDVGNLTVSGGKAVLDIDASGAINLDRIIRTGGDGDQNRPKTSSTGADREMTTERGAPWRVNLKQVDIDKIALDYSNLNTKPALNAGVGGAGVQFAAEIRVGSGDPHLRIYDISASLTDLLVGASESDEPVIKVDRLAVENGELDPFQRNLTVDRVELNGGHINLVRNKNGSINLINLTNPPANRKLREIREEAIEEVKQFAFRVDRIEVNNFTAAAADRGALAKGALINLEGITANLTDVDGTSEMPFEAGITVKEGGKITAHGTIVPAGPSLEADIDLTGLALTPFQPYLDPVVALKLYSGVFSTSGKLRFKTPKLPSDLAYDGGFGLTEFRLTEPGAAETFLGWKMLKTTTLKFRLNPNRLEIGEVGLSRPEAKLFILEDGSVNMARVVKTQAKSPATQSAPSDKTEQDMFPIHVGKLRVDDGILDFADLSLRPQFGTQIHELGGAVIGISTARDARAQVEFEGAVDKYGHAKIGGEINVLDPISFTDISMDFRNVEMSNLTPYSGKFAGRRIDSGKLSLNLEYKIEKSALLGENQVIVDRLVLGEKIESDDATNLPLDFAIALMEDQNGRIDIGLPVSGDLNDPEFHYGHLVWKAITTLIGKLVTSPFRALGGMFGDEEKKYDAVVFEPGDSVVPPPEREKLMELAEALKQRPQLKLVVQGRYSSEADGAEIKSLRVRRNLLAGHGVHLEPGEDPGPVDYSHPKAQAFLETMFLERFSDEELKELKASLQPPPEKPVKKGQKDTPPEKAVDPGLVSKALFNRMVETEPLPETILVELAENRAKAILTELTVEGQVPMENLSVSPPEPLEKGSPISAKLDLDVAEKQNTKTIGSASGS